MRLPCLIVLCTLLLPLALAAESESANYHTDTAITSGSEEVLSSSYQQSIAMGFISGVLSSSSYLNSLGFLRTLLLSDGEPCTSENQCAGGYCCSNLCASSACPSGSVQVLSSGGGGGGGGGGGPSNFSSQSSQETPSFADFSIEPGELEFDLTLGEETQSVLTLENIGTATLDGTLSVEEVEDFISVDPDSFSTLSFGESVEINVSATGRRVGSYLGSIVALLEGEERTSDVIINVESDQALFDVSLDISPSLKTLAPGERPRAQITLFNVGSPREVDVLITYLVKNSRGVVMSEESETFAVLGERSFVHEFETSDLPEGKYLAAVEVRYGNSFAVSSSTFTVSDKMPIAIAKLASRNAIFFIALAVLAGVVYVAISPFLSKGAKGKKAKAQQRPGKKGKGKK